MSRESRGPRAPRIYEEDYYQRLRALEDRHWWSLGMREVAGRLLAPVLHNGVDLRVLDAGCGTGGTLAWLTGFPAVEHAVGIDVSPHALAHCQQRSAAQTAQASVTHLPFASQKFDLALCLDVIQHLPRDGSDLIALREILRVLRPQGVLFLRTNVRVSPNGGSPAVQGPATDFHQYTREELIRLVTAAGFALEKVSFANMVPALIGGWRVALRPSGQTTSGRYHGLTMRMPAPWINAGMKVVMRSEAWCLARARSGLPYGHSLVCLARRPRPAREQPTP